MSEVRIAAEPRTEFGKGPSRRIRRANKVPAVLYGHGDAPRHFTLPGHELMLALKHDANALLTLQTQVGDQLALPKSAQRDRLCRSGLVSEPDQWGCRGWRSSLGGASMVITAYAADRGRTRCQVSPDPPMTAWLTCRRKHIAVPRHQSPVDGRVVAARAHVVQRPSARCDQPRAAGPARLRAPARLI